MHLHYKCYPLSRSPPSLPSPLPLLLWGCSHAQLSSQYPGIPLHWGNEPSQDQGFLLLLMPENATYAAGAIYFKINNEIAIHTWWKRENLSSPVKWHWVYLGISTTPGQASCSGGVDQHIMDVRISFKYFVWIQFGNFLLGFCFCFSFLTLLYFLFLVLGGFCCI